MQDDTGTSYSDKINYFDGLGRPVETVLREASPLRKDILSLQEYDGVGRESNAWLPVPAGNGTGAYMEPTSFKPAATAFYSDSAPYSHPVYEPSPLNRVTERYAPGEAWRMAERPVKTDYLTNTSSGACSCALYSVASDNSLKRNGYYAACELFVTQTTDEDGHTGYTFTDKLGQMLLQRVMNGTVAHDTYYVYDDFGNLRYVLPPTTADALTAATTWPDTHAVLQNRVYIYKYDERNRCILKKLPGCDPVEMTYDRSDRLVFSRDGNQKAKGQWTFFLYDVFGRQTVTGTWKSATVPETENEVVKTNYTGSAPLGGYTVNLALAPVDLLTVNYYDDYAFASGLYGLAYTAPPAGYKESFTYDKTGNILTLQRKGLTDKKPAPSDADFGMIDNLSFTYTGNRVTKITDAVTSGPLYAGAFHFMDGADKPAEYLYDANGNLKKDYNKKIVEIRYNSLNLPERLQFANGNTIDYVYDAAGQKLSVTHRTAVTGVVIPMTGVTPPLAPAQIFSELTTDYCGNVMYEDGEPVRILTEEGYVTLTGNGNNAFPTYYYYLKDHQGNNRVVIDQAGTVEQVNHYYPFGGLFGEGLQTSNQPYRYNGKELDRQLSLDLYDYGARHYDAALGRWLTVDPMAEKYYSISSYVYCGNNPVRFIDPDGREWKYVTDANGHITINVTLNLSVLGNYTTAQINAYQNAISTQFHNTISQSSGGTMSGTITFYQGNADIVQSLSLGEMNGNIGGMTSYFNSSVNLYNSAGELRLLSSVASDATHEMLHTLRLEHPFEVTQTADTELLRVAPNSFVSTSTTDKNIVNNIMSYPMITIDGQKGSNLNSLTKGQLNFMLKEIDLQNQGYGFRPQYNPSLTLEQNTTLYKQYYDNYWNNPPGTPVRNQ